MPTLHILKNPCITLQLAEKEITFGANKKLTKKLKTPGVIFIETLKTFDIFLKI